MHHIKTHLHITTDFVVFFSKYTSENDARNRNACSSPFKIVRTFHSLPSLNWSEYMQPGTAATIVAAKIVSPSAAVPPVLLRMNVCVCLCASWVCVVCCGSLLAPNLVSGRQWTPGLTVALKSYQHRAKHFNGILRDHETSIKNIGPPRSWDPSTLESTCT